MVKPQTVVALSEVQRSNLKSFCSALGANLGPPYVAQPHITSTKPEPAHTNRAQSPPAVPGRSTKTDKPLDLGYATVIRLRDGGGEVQQAAVKKWEDWYKSNQSRPVKDWSKYQMMKVARYFSDIFFLDHVPFVDTEWKNDLPNRFGDSRHGNAGHVFIRIDPRDHSKTKKLENHQTAILSTFIHELTHGYFFAFCCDGPQTHTAPDQFCRRDNRMVWPKDKGDGHGLGWFLVACQIDIVMEGLIGLKGHLFSMRSIIFNCWRDGVVSAEDWVLFFSIFSWKEVEMLFQHLHDDKFERQSLYDLLTLDPRVVRVWAEQGEKQD